MKTKAIKSETGNDRHTSGFLQELMADLLLLLIKEKIYQWDVSGPDYSMLRDFFTNRYEETERSIDEIAYHIRSFNFFSAGAIHQLAGHSLTDRNIKDGMQEKAMLTDLLYHHEKIIERINKFTENASATDDLTIEFLNTFLKRQEKSTWLLRSYLTNIHP